MTAKKTLFRHFGGVWCSPWTNSPNWTEMTLGTRRTQGQIHNLVGPGGNLAGQGHGKKDSPSNLTLCRVVGGGGQFIDSQAGSTVVQADSTPFDRFPS